VSPETTATGSAPATRAFDLIETLAGEIGPRRPTSTAEAVAAEVIADSLRSSGVDARVERFASYASFAYPVGAISALALAPALLPRRWRAVRAALGLGAAGLLVAEGGLRITPVSNALSSRESRNVVASVEPRGEARRTLCLVAHSDTSRSGLVFHPALGPYLQPLFSAPLVAVIGLAAAPLLESRRAGRTLVGALRAVLAASLALLAERELRGEDVPGANDNASGAATVVQLAAEIAARPLESTRLAVLVAGSEEAGLLGTRAFLDSHDTDGWLFLNLDGVGAPATLRYLPAEGVLKRWDADPGLLALARRIERERPELGLAAADRPTGLTYDATAVLARGGRALSLVAGDGGRIPNYHRATDTVENIDTERLAKSIAVGRELIAMIDRGEADAA
jgi:Peptidase family M28